MTSILALLANDPLIALGVAIGAGVAVGRIDIKGVKLGPAAVLFTAIALSAVATSRDLLIEIPPVVGELGLILFTFTTGLMAGPGFFRALRTAWQLVVAVTGVLVVAAGTALGIGLAVGLDSQTIAGTYAGGVTNTPALAAAGGGPGATLGYAVSYGFSVVIMLAVIALALSKGNEDPDTPAPVVSMTVRVERGDVTVGELRARHGEQLTISRRTHHAAEPAERVDDDTIIATNDLLEVVGAESEVDALIAEIGHLSSHDLKADRSHLDYRRITISDPHLAGLRIRDLQVDRLGGSITRLRRGDVDMVPTADSLVQLGDRVRVVAPPEELKNIGRVLGDSARGLSEINAVAIGLGMTLGLLLGMIAVPIPPLGSVALGSAAGTLVVGLIMGRIGRVAGVPLSMPTTSAQVLGEIGLLLFLAYAGARAGTQILSAFASGEVVFILAAGIPASLVMAIGMYAVSRWMLRVGRIRLAGVLAGTQTNPAHLAFANSRTCHDPRVALGYALVYPAAMVVKILMAQVLSLL